MPTTSNFGWTTPADTDLVKDGAAAIRTLGSGIDTSLVDLKGGTTGQILSKNSNTDLDYTWINNDQGDITGVTAGTGISGGGSSGSVTITNDMATTLTTKGDILVATGSGTYARLGVGSNNSTIVANSSTSTGLEWQAPAGNVFVGCSVYKSTNQSVANGTYTAVTFDSEDYDTDAIHDNSTNNSRFTIPSGKGGKWLVTGQVTFAINSTGYRIVALYNNGSRFAYAATLSSVNGDATSVPFSYVYDFTAADYMEVFVWQNSSGNLNIESTAEYTNVQFTYLGA